MSIRLKSSMIAILIAILSVVSIFANTTTVSAAQISENPASSQSLISNNISASFASTHTDEAPQSVDDKPPQEFMTCERAIPGLGWLVCQIARGIFSVFDWLINDLISQNLLRVDPLEGEEGLRQAWSGFLTVANYFFILAFIIIIYAEASGRFGILEAYSATRVLPRLAFAAIASQLSFVIVGFLIAVFNDLGDGIGGLILAPVEGFSTFDFRGIMYSIINDESWFGIPLAGDAAGVAAHGVDNIMAGIVLIGGAAGALVAFPTILAVLTLSLALLILVLVIRKAILIAFIVLAPVAFVAFILPGTEKLFKFWWDNLIKLLAMYPIIIGFIASGQLMARLILAQEDITFTDSLIAMIAAFGPLFLVPSTFRFAGSALGGIAAGLQKRVENQKDPRNPNSIMSMARDRTGQRYDRLWNGEMKWGMGRARTRHAIMPSPLRRAYSRLPGTDVGAHTATAIGEARQTVDKFASTTGDDVFRALVVTGGGARKGESVLVDDGSGGVVKANSGWAKLGSNFVYNPDGSIKRDPITGKAFKADKYGNVLKDASGRSVYMSRKDFYSKDIMAAVHKLSGNKAMFQASAEYSIKKAENLSDQMAILKGMDMSRWTEEEKAGMRNGVWYSAKGDGGLHVKFMKTNFKNSPYQPGAPVDINYNPNERGQKLIDFDLVGMAEFMDKHYTQYEIMQLKGPAQHVMAEGIRNIDTTQLTDENIRQIQNIIWKNVGIVNSTRRFMSGEQVQGQDDDGVPLQDRFAAMGSSAVGEAARNAERVIQAYLERMRANELPQIQVPEDHSQDIFTN